MTEAEFKDLEECSEMFDFTGFTPDEDKRLLAEVRYLQQKLDTLCAAAQNVHKAWHHVPFNLQNMSMSIVALGKAVKETPPEDTD